MLRHTQAHTNSRWLKWVVWLIAANFFLFNYMNQVVPSAMADELSQAFNIHATMLGILAAVYFYTYAALQIPVGVVVDYYGPHRSLACAALMSAVGCLLFSFASSFEVAIAMRMIVGAGTSVSFIASLKLISNWFSAGQFGTLTGLTNIVGMIGAVVGVGLLTSATDEIGWRDTILILGIAGTVLAILILFVIRDHPAKIEVQATGKTQREHFGQAARAVGSLLLVRQNWVNGLYAATINSPYIALGALWGSKYLVVNNDLEKPTAAIASSLIFVGAIPGSFFFGWFSDRIRRRRLPMMLGAVGSLAAFSVQLYLPGISFLFTCILFLLLGFFCSANVVSYALAHDLCPPKVIGVAVGFVSTFLYGVGALLDPVIGWMMDQHAGHKSVGGGLDYTRDDFVYALSSLTVCLAVTCIASFFVHETRCCHTGNSSGVSVR
tara:strand:+ start:1516 stop:2826 length:1311 start_codon:yes stop_codon:yes gene_type:complete